MHQVIHEKRNTFKNLIPFKISEQKQNEYVNKIAY